MHASGKFSDGFQVGKTSIPELDYSVTVLRDLNRVDLLRMKLSAGPQAWKEVVFRKRDDHISKVITHEAKHQDNILTFAEFAEARNKHEAEPIELAKDEIIAYLSHGESPEEIKKYLTENGGLYDYFKFDRDHYTERNLGIFEERTNDKWESHKARVRSLVDIASKVRDPKGDSDLDLLSVMPLKHWKWIADD